MKGTTTKPWQLVSWRKRRKELLKDKCEICGKGDCILVLHHKYGSKSRNAMEFARYCLPETQDVITVCKSCHFRLEKDLILCSNCGKNWHSYRFRTCFECLPKRVKQEIEEGQKFIAEMRAIDMLLDKASEVKYASGPYVYISYGNENEGGQMTLPEGLIEEAKAVLGNDILIERSRCE